MTSRSPHPEPKPDDDEKTLTPPTPTPRPVAPAPKEGEMTRVLLTDENRVIAHEEWVPTAEYGFRIFVNGRPFEQVGVAADSGTTIFAPSV